MKEISFPSPIELSQLFSRWPDEFQQQFWRLQQHAVFRSDIAYEYFRTLVPLLNVQWEISYACSGLSGNKTLDDFYKTIFAVLREAGARFDWAVQDRPWQHTEPSYGAFSTRKRAITLLYHLEGTSSPQSWIYKEASLPGYVHIDPKGYAGWSRVAKNGIDHRIGLITDSEADEFHSALVAEYITGKISKYPQGTVAPPEGNYYFFPLQLIDDSVQRLARIKMLDLAAVVARELAQESRRIVFKRYPLCKSEIVSNFLKSVCNETTIIQTKASIHDLIQNAECIITVNSGVGFEALLQLKPVFVAGTCDYQAACHELKIIDDIANIPTKLKAINQSMRIKKILYYILNGEQCRATDTGHISAHLIRTMFLRRPTAS